MEKVRFQLGANNLCAEATATTQDDNFGGILNRWELYDNSGINRIGQMVEYMSHVKNERFVLFIRTIANTIIRVKWPIDEPFPTL